MTLPEYIKMLTEFVKDNPESRDLPVYIEGDCMECHDADIIPSMGYIDQLEFCKEENIEAEKEYYMDKHHADMVVNAICLNKV